jgi:hypothetical protein
LAEILVPFYKSQNKLLNLAEWAIKKEVALTSATSLLPSSFFFFVSSTDIAFFHQKKKMTKTCFFGKIRFIPQLSTESSSLTWASNT